MHVRNFFRFCVYLFAFIGFVLTTGYLAVRLGLTNEKGLIDNQDESFMNNFDIQNVSTSMEWAEGQEWGVLKKAIIRDSAVINKAANDADIDPRLIVAVLVPEQLRLFHSEREIFKQIFQPLEILGNQSQFSWGIMGLKQETAKAIEEHLKDRSSPFYLGQAYEKSLDFITNNTGNERFERITTDRDHYYGYLYAALYLKQVENQWKKAGFDISGRPEILATLYNIGFDNSKPKARPFSGGASIEINSLTYSFGSLAGKFFDSDELRNVFP